MKTTTALIAAIFLASAAQTPTSGFAAPAPTPNDPFSDGTRTVVLSHEERASLLQFADNSKAKLEKALRIADGESFEEQNRIYYEAIQKVVLESYKAKPRSELLMRIVLNQALELTYGIPEVVTTYNNDGSIHSIRTTGNMKTPGVLNGSMNRDLLTLILEDSVKLAIHYYKDDRKAIQEGSLLKLPYSALARDRITLAKNKWLASVLEWRYRYAFSVTALKHWLSTIANEEQLNRTYFAEEITEADDFIKAESKACLDSPNKTSCTNGKNKWEVMRRVRVYRRILRETMEGTEKKLAKIEAEKKAEQERIEAAKRAEQERIEAAKRAEQERQERIEAERKAALLRSGHAKSGTPSGTKKLGQAENTVMKFVWIAPGTFMMGSPSSESGRNRDEDHHQVTITKGFEMQTTEVTQAQWEAVMGVNPSHFMGANRPVERVSWNEAQEFIKNLNEQNDGYRYRLPTEAEWEYAARAGTTTAYSFEDRARFGEYVWYHGNSGEKTNAVATKKPNAWGLYDVHGNVWEWGSDYYSSSLGTSHMTDPRGPSKGTSRVIRGDGYGFHDWNQRSAIRRHYGPNHYFNRLGLRLSRTSVRR